MGTYIYTMKVLILVDDSENALATLRKYLTTVYNPEKHTIALFHAKVPPAIPMVDFTSCKIADNEIARVMTEWNKREADLDASVCNILREDGGDVEVQKFWKNVEVKSRIGECALQVADEYGAELIVSGSRGLRGLKKQWLGSVSDYVIRNASCAVMVNKM